MDVVGGCLRGAVDFAKGLWASSWRCNPGSWSLNDADLICKLKQKAVMAAPRLPGSPFSNKLVGQARNP